MTLQGATAGLTPGQYTSEDQEERACLFSLAFWKATRAEVASRAEVTSALSLLSPRDKPCNACPALLLLETVAASRLHCFSTLASAGSWTQTGRGLHELPTYTS